MKTFDWYIIRKFLGTFFYSMLLLVLVIIVIDFVEKNDDYIEKKVSYFSVIYDYYFNFAPYIANILSPITIFIAVVFVTSKLAFHSEIIAILSSGMSYNRLLFPFLLSSGVISIFTFYLMGWVIPEANKKRIAFEIAYIKNPYRYSNRDIHLKIGPETYIYMESYNNMENVGYKFSMEHIVKNRLIKKLMAPRVFWDTDKKCWTIEQFEIRKFEGMKEKITNGKTLDTVINLNPTEFSSNWQKEETMKSPELTEFIHTQQARGKGNLEPYIVKKYQRFTYPFATIILTLIGVVMSSRKSRGGIGLQVAIGFLLAFMYILFVIMSSTIATNGSVPPLLAVWLPNIIFSFIGFALLWFMPK
ncbi:MAG: permease [Bacteroidetes bacterium RIFCSPLOWO2_02_FULL_36_8]|nr:MAG: permease [Bacteroidetes bacterium RIFCSPLOWO2_02_FULL_36_8]OFY69804.1 MAG: permease [Bacteroidetes bacterium RIFCSPLOWO2_12_FULL_37_12]